MIERRKNRRVQVLESVLVKDRNSDATVGCIRDISRQGMMLSGSGPFVTDQSYQFRIQLPRPIMGTEYVDVDAMCKWETIDSRTQATVAGFQFAELAPEDELVVLLMGAEYAVSGIGAC